MIRISILTALAQLSMLAAILPARGEYYGFTGTGSANPDGADILYQETRYPYWPEHTYNARWYPTISGTGTKTSFYSGPAFTGDGGTGTQTVTYIWSFWGIDNPITKGDSVKPLWWYPKMYDVPSIGEGASGKVEGDWQMTSGVWYPTATRVWRPEGGAPGEAMAGQWFKDGVTGEWHHMGTFRLPFAATHFTGDGGFIEDPARGNRYPRRVDFRNYYFHKDGVWAPATIFKCSTRQASEKGTSGLIEGDSAVYFETCSGTNYRGNMGPGAQEVKYVLKTPSEPKFDPIVLAGVTASSYGSQLDVRWSLAVKSSPQFSYEIQVFPGRNTLGEPIQKITCTDPDATEALISTTVPSPTVRVVITDIFDQKSAPAIASAMPKSLAAGNPTRAAMPGLAYKYYEGPWTTLPEFNEDLDNRSLVQSGAVDGIDASIARRSHGFACRYEGCIAAPADGIWLFTLRSSDGSRLLIDGGTVIDNDGIHSSGYERAGAMGLKAGYHKVELDYFKGVSTKDGDVLRLTWQGPGTPKQEIPDGAWSRGLTPGEPAVRLVSPSAGSTVAANASNLAAQIIAGSEPVQSVRFYNGKTCYGSASVFRDIGANHLATSPELLGAGLNHLKARLVYGNKGQFTVDSPASEVNISQPDISPWRFSAIGPHVFATASSVSNGDHVIVGDNLNIDSQLVTGDAAIIAQIKRRPDNSWVSQYDGASYSGDWSGGIIFREDLDGYPGSEIGSKFVTLFASASNGIYLEDNTNHNAGGYLWGKNLQDPATNYTWLKLQRTGNVFNAFLSLDGKTWTPAGSRDMSGTGLSATLNAGVYTLARPSRNTNPNRWEFGNVQYIPGNESSAH